MSGGGYYNAAAGAYIPMGGGSVGGYVGGYDPIMRTTTFSAMLDVYVYRGVDGKCLGSFYFSFPSLSKKEDAITAITAFKKHVDTIRRSGGVSLPAVCEWSGDQRRAEQEGGAPGSDGG
jgi:hypothetical protein